MQRFALIRPKRYASGNQINILGVDIGGSLLGALPGVMLWALKEIFVPDILDRHKQRRAAELQHTLEQRAYEREDAPVRARIISAACDLLRSFQRVFARGAFSLKEWQTLHDKLYQMVDCDTGARALGQHYVQMMEVLNYDQLGINVQASIESGGPLTSKYLQAQHDAQFTRNVATTSLRFVPILDALTADVSIDALSRSAHTALALADQTLSRLPDGYDS